VEVLPGFIWKTAGEGSPPPKKARTNAAVQEQLFGAESPVAVPKKAKTTPIAADPKTEPEEKKERPRTHVYAQGDCSTCHMRLHACHACSTHADACKFHPMFLHVHKCPYLHTCHACSTHVDACNTHVDACIPMIHACGRMSHACGRMSHTCVLCSKCLHQQVCSGGKCCVRVACVCMCTTHVDACNTCAYVPFTHAWHACGRTWTHVTRMWTHADACML
jgi:hypothetical protein